MSIERDIVNLSHNKGPDSWVFFDDFNDLNISATAGAAKWELLETDAAATELLDLTVTGGVLKLLQDNNDADVCQLEANAGIKVSDLKAGAPIYFGVRFKTDDADDTDLHMGLGIKSDTWQASAPADFCVFQLVEGAATLNLRTSKDSVLTSALAIATVADNTWVRAFFKYTPGTTTDIGRLDWTVHSNGTKSEGYMDTNGNFPDDVVIFPVLVAQNGAAATDATSVDWVYAYATRAAYTDGTG